MIEETKEDNIKLSDEEKLQRIKEAKGGTWYDDNYTPYCGCCRGSQRTIKTEFGFKCTECGNLMGFNMRRLKESPLNDIAYFKYIRDKKLYPQTLCFAQCKVYESGNLVFEGNFWDYCCELPEVTRKNMDIESIDIDENNNLVYNVYDKNKIS